MSLPVSLMTDCGGLLNRRFSRAKALLSHGGSSRGISCLLFTRMVLVPNYRIIEFFFTRSIAESHGSIVPDLRIVEFFFTRMVAEVTVFSHEFSFCPELSNCRIFFTRNVTDGHGLFVPRLVLGPTDQREVIIEFLSSRGMSRMVAEVMRVEL